MSTKTGCNKYYARGSSAEGPGHCKVLGHLPATYKAQLLQKPQAICELGEVGSQRVTWVERVVFTGVMQIQVL